ncbi:alpha-L-fucosidase [Paenibacillus yonginensis]|uniref:Alpha-L-fucosidase n=1 Tax=Paenibacillus yonginensis TaxID=1462996 RepID=A0A1B1MYT9_9BACL|nr:glycoside hydrolase family 95 protein [Paenibacillus yonginensis]ANS74319.1 alpha-L-fucosidase [Paenibacillus yonginensis]
MNKDKLWYLSPAKGWGQGLPVGNGRMGAVVLAEALKEVWVMTEVTYWSGQPEEVRAAGGGKEALEEMRSHFFAGDYAGGDQLAKRYLQPDKQNFGTNLSLCDLIMEFQPALSTGQLNANGAEQELVVYRELDLGEAVVRTEVQKADGGSGEDSVLFTREVIATHAEDLVAGRVRSAMRGGLHFTLRLEGRTSEFKVGSEHQDAGGIRFQGRAVETIHSDGSCGVSSAGAVKVQTLGGTVSSHDGIIQVTGADEAVIYVAVNTDYKQKDGSWSTRAAEQVKGASAKGFDRLKAEHLADYKPLYERVQLDLGTAEAAKLPLDARIRRFKEGKLDDPALVELFFQYGRYLTIAGAREDSPLPLNLQGIWNDGEANRMAWSCDYHLDINTQMNYYPTEIANLGESHVPLMNYVEELAKAGRTTARDWYGADGWVAHVFSNAWGFTLPGWQTGWGLNVTGGLWIATHLMEHYEYSLDERFLWEQAYPVLKEAAAFFLDYMTEHPKHGWLVTGPSNSPENSFYTSKPEEGGQQLSMGPTMDMVLVRDLLQFCLKAARQIQLDEELQERWSAALAKLPPLQIGKQGQLQEWLEDYEEAQPEHRHLSHLTALYPGNQIHPERTRELADAAKVTLEKRMGQSNLEDVEFTAALFAIYFARLQDGDRALKHVSHLIGELCLDNLLTFSKAGIAGAETNIFVIDGNYGGTAAVAEMLMHSLSDEIELLPALPRVWGEGRVIGLRAKGGFEVDLEWSGGVLQRADVHGCSAAGSTWIRYKDQRVYLELAQGETVQLNGELQILQTSGGLGTIR